MSDNYSNSDFESNPNNNQSGTPPMPPPYYYNPQKKKKTRWWIPLIIIGVVLTFFFLMIAGIGMTFSSFFKSEPIEVKENSVLYLNLNFEVGEYTSDSPMSIFTNKRGASFLDIIRSIQTAKSDNRIKGIYIKAEQSSLGFAKLNELNSAIEDFKKSGKFVYAYLESGTEKDYMLTLPAQKIFMPLEGLVMIDGFGTSGMFYKNFLDKIGVNFFVAGFEDFKSAAESFSRDKYSDSSRMQLQVYIHQTYDNFLDAINRYRNIDKNKANMLLDEGIYTTDGMKAAGFIDEIAVETRVKDEMAKLVYGKSWDEKKKLNLVNIKDYINSEPYGDDKNYSDKGEIAIVYGSGAIYPGNSGEAFSSSSSIYSSQFVKNLRKAVYNDDVKAIIIRIDSPGGSVLGSEIIWQEIIEAKKKKPVYASMSDVAASGGYYIASACDTIIAHPQTLTGSIGVISSIPNFSGALSKLGITIDTVRTNKNTHFFNPTMPVQEEQKAKFFAMSKDIYYRFLNKVATARKMTVEQVRSVAKGRIWTGQDAKAKGLVDVLGDLRTTINIAKKRIGIPENQLVKINIYPKADDELAGFLKLFGGKSNDNEDDESAKLDTYLKSMSLKLGQEYGYFSAIYKSLPKELQNQFLYLMNLIQMSSEEKILMAMPQMIDVN